MTNFRDNLTDSRYEYEMNGAIAYAEYRKEGGVLTINYVFAPEALRGTGAAGKLMESVTETARREGLKVIPRCGYAASWISKHPECADLLS